MSDFEYWRLCEQLTLIQTALLMANDDPSNLEHEVERWSAKRQPSGYAACRQALIGAVRSQRLSGYLHYDEGCDNHGNPYSVLDIDKSYVLSDSIAEWLSEKGMRTGFFFPESDSPREYLDPDHERFAPKLAAAVRAWQAAGEEKLLKGTPKQKVEKWLRLHASEYGLTQKDGKPNESAIEAIARIANWKPEGGAPMTPGATADAVPTRRANVVKLKTVDATPIQSFELDDDIAF